MLPLLITQTPASGKAPFGSTNDPLDADSTRYFPLVTATDRIAGYTRSCRARNWGSIPGCDLERLVLSLTSSSPATTLACPAWLARKCHLVNPAQLVANPFQASLLCRVVIDGECFLDNLDSS